MAENKRILLIHRQPPLGEGYAKAGIDVALMAVILGQSVSHLFLGDGVLQILKDGDSHLTEQWHTLLELKSSHYFVEHRALKDRGLSKHSLLLPTQALNKVNIQAMIQQQDCILTF